MLRGHLVCAELEPNRIRSPSIMKLVLLEGGGSPFHIRSSTTTFRPTWSRTKTENCVDRRRKRTNPEVLIGTIEEREWWPLPSRGHRRRTMSGTGWEPSVGYALEVVVLVLLYDDMEIDPDRDLYLSIDREIWREMDIDLLSRSMNKRDPVIYPFEKRDE